MDDRERIRHLQDTITELEKNLSNSDASIELKNESAKQISYYKWKLKKDYGIGSLLEE